jgi:hypothetical protein
MTLSLPDLGHGHWNNTKTTGVEPIVDLLCYRTYAKKFKSRASFYLLRFITPNPPLSFGLDTIF